LTVDAKNTGSFPVEVRVFDNTSGENQSKQYILRVVDKPTEANIWANTADNYYERASKGNSLRIVLGDAPRPSMAGEKI